MLSLALSNSLPKITQLALMSAIALLPTLGQVGTGNFPLEDLLPANPYTRPYIDKMRGKRTLKSVLSRLYATSPEHWIKKLSEAAGK